MPRCLSPAGPGPWLCSPSLVPPLHCPHVFDLGVPELCGRAAPPARPSDSPRLTPGPCQGRGWCLAGSSPGRIPPQPESPQCRGARSGPGLPPEQLSLGQGACWQNTAMQAGSEERVGIPLGGDPPSLLEDLTVHPPLRISRTSQSPPHLLTPAILPQTARPPSQAQAALQEAASTLLREIP